MQNIHEIKKELKGFEEIDITFSLNTNCYLKYITIKDDGGDNNEYFYKGGQFVKYGFDKIFLKNNNNNKIWSVPTIYKDKDGEILYTTRLFYTEKNEEILSGKNQIEYEKIIQSQQMIIEKLSKLIKHKIN